MNLSIKADIVKELHRPARRKFQRRHVEQRGIDDTIQIDLVEMQNFSKENNGYRYLLTAINIFTKYAYVRPLKDKTAKEVTKAMKSILEKLPVPIKNIHSDLGKEFMNSQFKDLMQKFNINHYQTYSEMKASICERFNRTLKEKMWRMFSLHGNYKYVPYLQDLVKEYNNTKHRTIKMKPSEVNKDNEQLLLETVYKQAQVFKRPKFKIGDHVRLSRYKGVFAKGYEPNWSTEIFKITNVYITNPTTYTIKDYKGVPIEGKFYEKEMQKVKHPDSYLVERIIKKRGNKALVRWLGFDESHDTWEEIKEI